MNEELGKTVVVFQSSDDCGSMKLEVRCSNEYEYLIAVENRKWLYPKIMNMIFGAEHTIRGDPSSVFQINNILNDAINDLRKLNKIIKEENDRVR